MANKFKSNSMRSNYPGISVVLTVVLAVLTINLHGQQKVVKTKNGLVAGDRKGEIAIFKGIPFAEPPVGELRWKAPMPKKDWMGALDCRQFSPSPMQNKPAPFMMWTEEFIAPPDKLSEDCLYLNVWTPFKSKDDKLPVLVWIYGGGFSSGSAACAIYDGEEMAKKGIVFVSINYRVGVFGFLAHPGLSEESESGVSGNYGLLDQIAALKWVKDNIASFGGDPAKVTIAGQSAGSMSVWSMIASPLAKGLFRAAIPQSGGIAGGIMNNNYERAEKSGIAFMERLKAASITELRKLTAEELIAGGGNMMSGLNFAPVFDGYVLPENILKAFRSGEFNDVPVLGGWVMGDGSLMAGQKMDAEKYRQQAVQQYGDNSDEFLKIFPGSSEEEISASTTKLGLLRFAAMPDYIWTGFSKSPVYIYEFSHIPVDKAGFPNYGAFHTAEVPFALHTLHMWKRPWREADLVVEKNMNAYWVNFIKNGDPNGAGLPVWNAFEKSRGEIMEIGDKMKLIPGLYRQEFEFLYKTMQLN